MGKRGLAVEEAAEENGARLIKQRRLNSSLHVAEKVPSHMQLHLQTLPDELLVRILSFLAVDDLLKTQSVSRRMSALTKDSQLWKRLYYERFVYRRFGRIVKNNYPRPRRPEAFRAVNAAAIRSAMDWKSKYRLSHKWSNGTCNYREIMLASKVLPQTYLCLRGSMAVTVDIECGLRAWETRDEKQTLVASRHLQAVDEQQDTQPSALSVEVSEVDSRKLNIIVGFAKGHIGLYTFDLLNQNFESRQWSSCFHSQAVCSLAQTGRGYLLAMSDNQAISLYQAGWSDTRECLNGPRLISSLKSQSQWKPVSVNLRVSPTVLMASIIYAYPRFVRGWSVGLQELRWDPSTHELLSTRLATSPQSDASSKKNASKVEYLPPTTTKPTSLCYTHPYLLATHPDNTLSLYMVRSTDSELSISSGMRLWGHTSDVYAANIGDRGKAVTVAYGGDVRVWQLEEGLTSALARKATPGPLVSVKLQPISDKNEVETKFQADILSRLEAEKDEEQTPSSAEALTASIDFDEERLVVLKNRGAKSQALYIYDFT